MDFFKHSFMELAGWRDIEKYLSDGISPVCATGLSHIHKAQLLYTLSGKTGFLVVTDSEAEAKRLCDNINTMAQSSRLAMLYPAREIFLTSAEGMSRDYEHQRIEALSAVLSGECRVLAASAEAVMQPAIPPDVLSGHTLTIKSGSQLDLKEFKTRLVNMGYVRSDKVEGPSQFSVRGAIADIFPVQSEFPVRIELWGDDVDSIAYFDPETQRRTESAGEFRIAPAIETITDRAGLAGQKGGSRKGKAFSRRAKAERRFGA